MAMAVAGVAMEEAQSPIATVLGQILSAIKEVILWALKQVGNLIQWTGEHPLAATLMVTNIVIWMS